MLRRDEYGEKCIELEKGLKPQLTVEFLSTLVEAAKVCGWDSDYGEVQIFVEWCFRVAGTEPPDLEPYLLP